MDKHISEIFFDIKQILSYTQPVCHLLINLKREKERVVTGFWLDLGLKPAEECYCEGVKKAEKGCLFNISLGMLPKKYRVNKKGIDLLFKEGKSINSDNLIFKFLNIDGDEGKISFIAPKNIAKSAVERNRLRRLGYSALKNYLGSLAPGIQGVFIFKKYQAPPVGSPVGLLPKGLQPRDDISVISNEIKNILNKIN